MPKKTNRPKKCHYTIFCYPIRKKYSLLNKLSPEIYKKVANLNRPATPPYNLYHIFSIYKNQLYTGRQPEHRYNRPVSASIG